MDLREDDFRWAASEGLISDEQANKLWQALSTRPSTSAKFDFLHVAYYFGALLVMGAMGFFVTLAWESLGGGGIFAVGVAYVALFVAVGRVLWKKPETRIPGGLCFTIAVSITPLAMYGLERLTGMWPTSDPGTYRDFHAYIRSGWLWMELETILAGLIALRFVRFPFLTAPVAFIFWYMSMDLAPLLFGEDLSWSERGFISAAVGALMLLVGYLIDRRTREDFAYWLYLFGLLAFSGGLSSVHSDSQLGKLAFALIHLGMIVVAVLIDRRVFLVFGALGVFGYLGYLSWEVFENSVAFPFALSFLGILVLFTAVKYAKNRAVLDAKLQGMVPAWVRTRLPQARLTDR